MTSSTSQFRFLGFCLLVALVFSPGAFADSLTVKSKTKGQPKFLVCFYPPVTSSPAPATLRVVPLLSPAKELLPNGKLIVWAGLSDGTPLSIDVTVSVPAGAQLNSLDGGDGQRLPQVTLHTNAQGLAEVYFAAPDQAPPNPGANGGNGGGGNTGE